MSQSLPVLNDCPLCKLAALVRQEACGDLAVQCERCGTFIINDAARVMLDTLPLRYLVALTRASHECSSDETTMHITVQNVAQLVAPYL